MDRVDAAPAPAVVPRALVALALLAVSLAFALALFVRNSRFTVPLVLGDEYYYSHQTDPNFGYRQIGRTRQMALPRTLILALWNHGPSREGDPYFTAKSLNALLCAGILFPIYAIARRLGSPPGRALACAALGLAMPFHVYSSYFMPESALALTFWCAVAAYLRAAAQPAAAGFALCGLAAGLHYLVKPHGALLVATLVVAQLAAAIGERRVVGLGRGIAHGGVLLASFLAAALGGGWLLSGRLVSLGLYHSVLRRLRGAGSGSVPFDLSGALAVAADHLLVLGGILSWTVPLLCWRAFARHAPAGASRRFFGLAALYLLAQIAAVSWYTQAHGEAGRIHLRYYNFVLPAFLLLLAARWDVLPRRLGRWTCALTGTAALAAFWLGPARQPQLLRAFFADAPELVVLHAAPSWRWILPATAVAAAVAFGGSGRRGLAAGGLQLAVTTAVLAALLHTNLERQTLLWEPMRRAGTWLEASVPEHVRSRGVVIGPRATKVFATLFFYTGAPKVKFRGNGAILDLERQAESYAWAYWPSDARYQLRNAARFPRLESRQGTLVDLTGFGLLGIRGVTQEAPEAPPAASP